MTIRDRELLEELREDPELLALADAVVETQRISRRFRPWGAVTVVALAAALFLLVLASPWDRGGEHGSGSILDRALAAIPTGGPVSHLTIQLEQGDGHAFSPVTNEAFYDKRRGLARVVSRNAGATIADYTTRATEDEFTTFPGLLAGAEYYREALASGNATIVGQGIWRGRLVHWVRLEGRGGLGVLQIGIDRDNYRPVVFRLLDADGTPSGFQVAVLGFDYVSTAEAAFEPDAPVLVRGTVLGRDCRPTRARIGAVLKPSSRDPAILPSAEIASARSGPDGRFTLRVDPRKDPFLGRSRFDFTLNAQVADPTRGFAFVPFRRVVRNGTWVPRKPLVVRVPREPASECD